MATTTNYGWETPDDTDLVKDGAAAIRLLGSEIDSTFAELKGGTSGQMLTKASNTDNDYAWVTPEIGDITAITATSPLTGGGTSGDVTVGIQDGTTSQKGAVQLEDSTSSTSTVKAATPNSVKSAYDLANAAIPKSTATTAGDILYRNGSTVTRLGIGTAGQVLQVNSGATAPQWASAASGGGMTLLSTTTLSGSSTSISVTPTGYEQLFIKIYGMNISANNIPRIGFNSDGTSANYTSYWAGSVGYGTTSGASVSGEMVPLGFPTTNGLKNSTSNNIFTAVVYEPNSTLRKMIQVNGAFYNDSNYDSNLFVEAAYLGGSAVSSIQVLVTSGSFNAGTIKIYGVK